jgi:DNA helicase INO80
MLVNEDWSMAHVKADDSAKLAYLEELLDEVVAGEHRALLFCRSTRMHQILERFLNEWGIKFLQLTGDTPTDRRQQLVDQFNSSPDITVFLLSMAGSSGINLTSADTVIFYDHDWNPANDAQAMDRAYRIGQKKDVTVYRLVSKGTIEERILERQRAKQNLADEVIGADASGFKDLTKEELVGLFQLDSGDQNGL